MNRSHSKPPRSKSSRSESSRSEPRAGALPTRDEILAFVARQPGKVGTREIARAFGLKGADRAALRGTLKEMADGGEV